MSADIIAALVNLLSGHADLASTVDTRVYGGEMEECEPGSQPRGAIVVRRAGGLHLTAGSYAELRSPRIDFLCYGQTPQEAEQIARIVDDIVGEIKRGVHSNVLIHWANIATDVQGLRDPGTDWPFAVISYQIQYDKRAA